MRDIIGLRGILLAVATILSAPAVAQVQPDTTVWELPAVVVTGARRAGNPENRVLDVRPADQVFARSATDLIRRLRPGDVRQYGLNGSATLSVRGLGSAHTTVLLDGLPVIHPLTGAPDLSLLPVMGIRTLRLAAGPSSPAHGLGGALSLELEEPVDHVAAHAAGGAWNERVIGVGVGRQHRGIKSQIAWQGTRDDGAFPYVDPFAFENPNRVRKGADVASSQMFVHTVMDRERTRTKGLLWMAERDRGLPGPANAVGPGARQHDVLNRFQLTQEQDFGRSRAQASVFLTRWQLRFLPGDTRSAAANHTVRDVGARIGWTRFGATARPFVIHAKLMISSEAVTVREDSRAVRRHDRVRLEPSATLEWTGHRVRASTFVRWFDIPDQRPALGMGAHVSRAVSSAWDVTILAGRSLRIPSLGELYAAPVGNPDLRPEEGWSADLSLGRPGFRVGFFAMQMRDRIIWRPVLAGPALQVFRPENIGRAQTVGGDIQLARRVRWGHVVWETSVACTLTWTRDISDRQATRWGHPLPYAPRSAWSARLMATFRSVEWHVSAARVARRFITSDATQWLDPYVKADVEMVVPILASTYQARVLVQLHNALNTRWESMRLYPMPPRHLRLGIQFSTT